MLCGSNLQKPKMEWWLPGSGKGGGELFNGYRISDLQGEQGLGICIRTMWIYLTHLNNTHKND